jgi:hypothetical protein
MFVPHPMDELSDDNENAAEAFERYKHGVIQTLTSPIVIKAALENPQVVALRTGRRQADLSKWLEENLKFDFNLSPELLRVSLDGRDPAELITLLDAIVDAAVSEVNDSVRKEQLIRLQNRAKEFDEELRAKRAILVAMTQQRKLVVNPEAHPDPDRMNQEIRKLEAKTKRIGYQIQLFQAGIITSSKLMVQDRAWVR